MRVRLSLTKCQKGLLRLGALLVDSGLVLLATSSALLIDEAHYILSAWMALKIDSSQSLQAYMGINLGRAYA